MIIIVMVNNVNSVNVMNNNKKKKNNNNNNTRDVWSARALGLPWPATCWLPGDT